MDLPDETPLSDMPLDGPPAPEPTTIKILGAQTVADALDPDRRAAPPDRYAAVKEYIAVMGCKVAPTATKLADMGAGSVNMDWKESSLLGAITVSQNVGVAAPPLPWYAKATLRARDMLRVYAAPLAWAGRVAQNAPLMGGDAYVIFPGEDLSGDVADEALPLDPAADEFARDFDVPALERAAVVLGTHADGSHRLYQAKVRRVRRSAKLVLEHLEATLGMLDKLPPDHVKRAGAAQLVKIGETHRRQLALVTKLVEREGGGDANNLQLVMHEYSVAFWEGKSPYTPYLKQPLLDAIVACDNKFELTATAESAGKVPGMVVKFAIKFVVPFAQHIYTAAIKKQQLESKAASDVATPTAKAAAAAVTKPAPESKDLAQASAANTEKAVAAAQKKEKEAAAAAAAATAASAAKIVPSSPGAAEVASTAVAATLASLHEQNGVTDMSSTPFGGGGGDDAEKSKPASKPKPVREELGTTIAGTTAGPQKVPKSAAKKGAKSDADPDADVDDKVPAATPVVETVKTPTSNKRKQSTAPADAATVAADEPPAKRAAVANGTPAKPTADKSAYVYAEPVVIGSPKHHAQCVAITQKYGDIKTKAASRTDMDDQRLYGVLRGYMPQGLVGDAAVKADEVQRAAVGELWQAANFLGVTDALQELLVDKHLKPKPAVAKAADDELW